MQEGFAWGWGELSKILWKGRRNKDFKKGGDKLGQAVGTLKKGQGGGGGGGVELPYKLCITGFYFLRIMDYGIELFPLIWNPLYLITPQSHKFQIGEESVEIL